MLRTPQILSLFSITEGRWCKLLILRTGPTLLVISYSTARRIKTLYIV